MVNENPLLCPAYEEAIAVLARPWTGLLLVVLQDGPLGFSQVVQRSDGITDKVLSQRLKELEAEGLLTRSVEPGPPVRTRYELTGAGRAYLEVARAIEKWGRVLQHRKPVHRRKKR